MVAFGILLLREHVLTPDGPCGCRCDEASEDEEEVLVDMISGLAGASVFMMDRTYSRVHRLIDGRGHGDGCVCRRNGGDLIGLIPMTWRVTIGLSQEVI